MRPRHKAAENAAPQHALAGLPIESASMRPRHKAAENLADRRPLGEAFPGFNEAAA